MPPSGKNCLTCIVRGTDCFCSLPLNALHDLQVIGSHKRFNAGEHLLYEGFNADRVYIVCQGCIKLTASSSEGKVFIIRIAGPGDVIGLASAMQGTTYKIAAEAMEPCEVKVISRSEFLDFMDRFREVNRNAVVSISLDCEAATLSARRLALSSSAAGKLASVLIDWGRMGQTNGILSKELHFRMPLTHEELGSMAGLSRETVTRLLGKFRREGLIKLEGEQMTVREPEKLERLYH